MLYSALGLLRWQPGDWNGDYFKPCLCLDCLHFFEGCIAAIVWRGSGIKMVTVCWDEMEV